MNPHINVKSTNKRKSFDQAPTDSNGVSWAISSTIPGSRADTEGEDSSSLSAKSLNCH